MPGWTDAPPAEAYSAQQHASAPAAGLGQAAAATQPWAAPQPWTAGMEAAPAVWAEGTHAGLEAQHAAPATLAAAPLPPQQAGPTAASQAVAGSFAASALLRAERQQQVQGPPSQGEGDEPQHPLTVTVSAVAAGWAPDRSGRAPTGSGPCSVPVVSHPAAFAVATAPGLASFIWALCADRAQAPCFDRVVVHIGSASRGACTPTLGRPLASVPCALHGPLMRRCFPPPVLAMPNPCFFAQARRPVRLSVARWHR